MGLDASVMCDCLKQRRTSEPPVPREWLIIDDEGQIAIVPEHDSPEAASDVYHWMEDCCGHPGMQYASECIANWGGYRLFQEELAEVGWGNFPVLHRELPEDNGGRTDASESALALEELTEFRKVGRIGLNTCLVDTSTGEVVMEHVAAYEGVFIMCGDSGLEAGFDVDGFFVRTSEDRLELFRAIRFQQTSLDPEADRHGSEPCRFLYVDLNSGPQFECPFGVPSGMIPWPDGRMQDDQGRLRSYYPTTLHVEERAVDSSDFEYILGPLERIFLASVEMRNPVRWG